MPITQDRLMDLINLATAQNDRLHQAHTSSTYLVEVSHKMLIDQNIQGLHDCALALAQLIETAALMPRAEHEILANEKAHFKRSEGYNARQKALMQRRRRILSEEKLDRLDPQSEEIFTQIETQTQEIKQEKTFAILPPSAEELWTKIKSVWRNHMPFIDGGSIASLSPTTDPELIQELIDTLVNDGRLKPGQFPGEYIPQTETIAPSKQATGFKARETE